PVDIAEEGDRHPLAGDDQVDLTVTVEVGPERGGDQPDLGELRGDLLSHIGETWWAAGLAIVAQQEAARRQRVLARDHPSPHEEVQVAVAIEISGDDDRPADVLLR